MDFRVPVLLIALGILVCPRLAAEGQEGVPYKFQGAVQARIEKTYAVVLFSTGKKAMVPLASLQDAERAWIDALAADHPLAHGNSQIKISHEADSPVAVKKTIEKSTVEGPVETVQLCAPNILRDQVGPTCMLYAQVHWLDIAGYYVDTSSVISVAQNAGQDPWHDPAYLRFLDTMVTDQKPKPIVHHPGPNDSPFEWAREELRKGHPVLAAFPREIWQDLPPSFIASHGWDGDKVGHAIVVNGFVWNKDTQKGTFHIVNSWSDLAEFDLPADSAKGTLRILCSALPKGEVDSAKGSMQSREVVIRVDLLGSAGKTNLYRVETNLGSHRVAAASESDARAMFEASGSSN